MKKLKPQSIRLPNHISPVRYTLMLKPDLEAFTFSGNEVIDITLDKDIKEITLHSKDIKIDTVEIKQGKNSRFANKISYNIKAETATFSFKQQIKKGSAKLSIVFEGIINDNLRGFYRSRYTLDGKDKHLATTQFEATDARRAFPCFDEPAHKAIFDVSLIIPGHHTAISNTTPSSIKEYEGGYKVVEFASTPRMSTYLLAFIIGEFEYVEGWTKGATVASPGSNLGGPRVGSPDHPKLLPGEARTQVRVFTTSGKKHQAKYALDVAIKSLEFYNEYFNIPYPLPVLDLIAIPDFESAAMENWGAVTFRESTLLIDEEHSSLSNKQWVAIVIAHELAHQWFGNLVTMRWWTDLWLNEGFASYMENLCVDHMFPDWHIWDLYIADRYQVALRLDSLANSHPIEVVVHHPDEISEIFDMVSYAKGSAVIRQLAEYLGHEKFRDGMRHYLKKHSYKNTDTIDLWDALSHKSGKPVRKMMEAWTRKTGYPLVSLIKKNAGYLAMQERFFSSRISKKKSTEKTTWQIPLAYESDGKILKTLATGKYTELMGKSVGKVNKGEGTFMRVRYDKDTLVRLKIEVENKVLDVKDRLGIIRDMFSLAEAGYISTVDALEFSLAYKDETEYIVWSEIAGGIGRIYNLVRDESWSELYQSYALSLFSPLAERMTFDKKDSEPHSNTFLRSLAISSAAKYGDRNVIKEAQQRFKNLKKNKIPADIRTAIYCIVAQSGKKKEWVEFQKLYKDESLHEEKDRYGAALASFRDKVLLEKTLAFALSKNVRDQDGPYLIGSVWQNPYGRDLTWRFIKRNWKEIMRRYGSGGFLSRLISPLGSHIKTKDATDAKKFFKKNGAPGADRTLEQSYERIYSNAAWLASDKKAIKKWVRENY